MKTTSKCRQDGVEIDVRSNNNSNVSSKFSSHHIATTNTTSQQNILPTAEYMFADSGASGHYLCLRDVNSLSNVRQISYDKEISVSLPDGSTINSTHIGELPFQFLSMKARQAHIFPKLQSSLLSVGVLCDDGCEVKFQSDKVEVRKNNIVLLTGHRDDNGLWMVQLQKSNSITHQANQVISHANHAALVQFVFLAMGAPAQSTFLTAVHNGYVQYPGLTEHMIHKNPPSTTATAKGHLTRTRQGIQSSKLYLKDEQLIIPETHIEIFPTQRLIKPKLIRVAATAMSIIKPGTIHADASGRFPVTGLDGTNYILIMYSPETNYIHVEPLKSRQASEYVQAYTKGHDFFAAKGYDTEFMHLDNETSKALEDYLKLREITYQFTPPETHRSNRAERAIQTFKNHFITMLCLTDPSYPVGAWIHLLWMAEFTLNMMRGSGITPTISAWHQLNGPYDWSSHPIAPAGTRVVILETPEQRSSWAPHGSDGWFISPALLHYRCYDVLTKQTMGIRTTSSVQWYPNQYVLPGGDPYALITAAIDNLRDCINLLNNHTDKCHNATYMNFWDALQQLRDIFHTTPTNANTSKLTEILEQQADGHSTSEATPEHNWTTVTKRKRRKNVTPKESKSGASVHQTGINTTFETRVQSEIALEPRVQAETMAESRVQDTQIRPISSAQERTVNAPAQSHSNTGNQHCNIPDPEQRATTDYTRRRRVPNPKYAALAKHVSTIEHAILCKPPNSDNVQYNQYHMQKALTAVDTDDTGKVLTYRAAIKGADRQHWLQASEEELERLMVTTKTISFINKTDIPPDYAHVAYYNPQIKTKIENGIRKFRVRGTIGGDQIITSAPVAAATASMTTVKTLFNVVVSEDAELMTADIKDFYLNTVLPSPEYMAIPDHLIPKSFIDKHNLQRYLYNNKYYVRVDKGIYGLPQAGNLAQQRLLSHLSTHGYHPTHHTPCLFKHEIDDIYFTLVVDDFAVKYKDKIQAQKLINVLKQLYEVHENWEGDAYLGYAIARDRQNRTLSLSLPGYVDKALKRFNVPKTRGARTPVIYTPPLYGNQEHQGKTNMVEYTLLNDSDKKRVEQIVGVFLYYARALDPTMLYACNKISTQQANPTTETMEWADRLLLYALKHPNAQLIYKASDLILKGASDASYLGDENAQSRAGGYWYLGNKDNEDINGHVLCISKIIPAIVASAGEAEYAALFMNAKEGEELRNTLEDFGYKQHATQILCDNSFSTNLAKNMVKQKRSKAIDMRWHWIRERVAKQHFEIKWTPGITNIADFFTKALPVKKFINYKTQIIHSPIYDEQYANYARRKHQQKWLMRFTNCQNK